MPLISFPPPLSPPLNASSLVPRSLSVFSGPSQPNPTQISSTCHPDTYVSSHTEVSQPLPPPPPATPAHWTWTCHQCNTTYRFAVTRQCLNDGHYVCQRRVQIKRRSGRARHYKTCQAKFDYTGWSLWAKWRRDQHPNTCTDRKQRDCWNYCDYPSHCQWGDAVDDKSKGRGVRKRMERGATTSENDSRTSVKSEAPKNEYDATQESLVVSKTKLFALKEAFGETSQASGRVRDRDCNSPTSLESPNDILSPPDDSIDEVPDCCGPNMDDDDSDDDQPPGTGAIAVTAFDDENSVYPIVPATPLAPLSPVRDLNLFTPTTSRSNSPNPPDVIPGARFQGLPVLSSGGSQDSGYESGTSEETCDGGDFVDIDFA